MIYGLDLFSGIGGLTLALGEWVRPIAYCESDSYAQAVLLSRMAEGILPKAPIWDDVRTLQAETLPARVEIIYGGFPCQDISVAGTGRGLAGERSGLVFEIFRLVEESKPTFIFLENVPAIRSRGAETVITRLADLGYDARWGVLSAFDVGAPHKRERWWCLASNAHGHGLRQRSERLSGRWQDAVRAEGETLFGDDGASRSLADANDVGLSQSETEHGEIREAIAEPSARRWWSSEPGICRVVNGLPWRMDRIRALGNSVVPAQAREAFQRLAGLK